MVNGITELAMMKADVLSGMERVRICTHYRIGGTLTENVPYDLTTEVHPVYEELPGWGPLHASHELPGNLNAYVARVERATGVPVRIVSIGADRTETLVRESAMVAH
jgi:adenylosuccinate synthase